MASELNKKLEPIRKELEEFEDLLFELISERIQLGEEVAKVKLEYYNQNHAYDKLNQTELLKLITNQKVEDKIIKRINSKAPNHQLGHIMTNLYKNYIIPKTKMKQLEYINTKICSK